MECLYGRISYASWRLRQFRQLVNSTRGPIALSHHRIRRTLSTSADEPQPPQPHDTPSAPPNETPSESLDKRPSESSPPPSSLLPKSPLLTDPKPANRQRLHKKKARSKNRVYSDPDHDLTKNPWAVALASPVRYCSLTGYRMPTEFLNNWGLDEHPEGSLFLHPTALLPAPSVPVPGSSSPSASSSPSSPSSPSPPQLPPTPRTAPAIKNLRAWIVNRLPLLTHITETLSAKTARIPAITHAFPLRWKPPLGPLTEPLLARCVWRQDMPQFLTRMMRRQVGGRLRKAASQTNDSAARQVWTPLLREGCDLTEKALVDALNKMEPIVRMRVGAVLVLRPMTSEPEPGLPLTSFFHLPQTGSKVPVFDVTRLLDGEDLACAKLEGQAAVFFRPDDRPTVDAMLGLWKLAGLLREDPYWDPMPDSS
ncbi:uncharacterized protein BO97DRAFT_424811 [Aspergillus homomorphus CBS 101889]|uniref:Uncharacterized protein n=1 Tax=Aspergillus homomorphus (strain CBS 101889) TaxID=1450537 RepID=A0A395HXT1_ASPHC|nr:hypothetical protein BO97DRAFT_424811 [Aspergillus homomorphus CBS 101889]RAL12289.1 hypothetical protein BO97DRAFT_424811 [Aspergillus homomorphus CBS 101889]